MNNLFFLIICSVIGFLIGYLFLPQYLSGAALFGFIFGVFILIIKNNKKNRVGSSENFSDFLGDFGD